MTSHLAKMEKINNINEAPVPSITISSSVKLYNASLKLVVGMHRVGEYPLSNPRPEETRFAEVSLFHW